MDLTGPGWRRMPGTLGGPASESLRQPGPGAPDAAGVEQSDLRPDPLLGSRAAVEHMSATGEPPQGTAPHAFAPCTDEGGLRPVLAQAGSGSGLPITLPPEPGCTLDQARRWVADTYGPGVVRQFDRHLGDRRGDVDAALRLVIREPTATQSWMGRDFYQIDTALDAMPPVLPRSGGRIAVIGCANGAEAYAFAAAALWRGAENLHVLGLDVNPEKLSEARDSATQYRVLRVIPALEAYFSFQDVMGGREGSPVPALRQCVDFDELDVLQRPLAAIAEGNAIVALRHVLKHYPEASRRAILANAVSGLAPGGLLVLEDTSDDVTGPSDAPRLAEGPIGLLKPEYASWRLALARPEEAAAYGLQAMDIGLPNKPPAYFRRV